MSACRPLRNQGATCHIPAKRRGWNGSTSPCVLAGFGCHPCVTRRRSFEANSDPDSLGCPSDRAIGCAFDTPWRTVPRCRSGGLVRGIRSRSPQNGNAGGRHQRDRLFNRIRHGWRTRRPAANHRHCGRAGAATSRGRVMEGMEHHDVSYAGARFARQTDISACLWTAPRPASAAFLNDPSITPPGTPAACGRSGA